jgi:hypothetical protein
VGAGAQSTVNPVANMGGVLPMRVQIDGHDVEAYSTYTAAAGGWVLTIVTVLPDRALAFELISTYVGFAELSTHVTRLALGPVGHDATVEHLAQQDGRLNPAEDARSCAYEHAHQLVEKLVEFGHGGTVLVDEHTFADLERVE